LFARTGAEAADKNKPLPLRDRAQAALRSDQLFTLDSVATPAGTRRALETVDKLAELHEAHKKMFATFVTAAMQQLTAALQQLTP
jgi:hypothetical protein